MSRIRLTFSMLLVPTLFGCAGSTSSGQSMLDPDNPPARAPAAATTAAEQPPALACPKMGLVTYWPWWENDPRSRLKKLNGDSLVIVNPESGALDPKTLQDPEPKKSTVLKDRFDQVVWNAQRKAKVLAYVPTGYFCSSKSLAKHCTEDAARKWSLVKRHIDAYLKMEAECKQEPCKIDGFFFDEVNPGDLAAPDYKKEFDRLRNATQTNGRSFLLAFNVGAPAVQIVDAAKEGEIVVTMERGGCGVSESDWQNVTTLNQQLRAKKINSWVMLHTTVKNDCFTPTWEHVRRSEPTYAYVTQDGGTNPWDSPSEYLGAANTIPCD